ncbi:MAG: ABC transporter ATP-binding protein, partial [Gammaproteobacteria bacterium]|nr:ABC transporter ATP-binding protein [Gammaproteobacteria bacterium]
MSDKATEQESTLTSEALHSLFKEMGLGVSFGDVSVALERADVLALPLLEQIKAILHGLNIKGVKGGMVAWRRFDRRQLPALVQYDGQWWLAKNGEQADSVLLQQAEGLPAQTVSSEELVESLVLWLQRANPNHLEDNKDQDFPTARKLILSALFQDKLWLGNVLAATVVINLLAIATSLFALQVYDRVVPTLAYSTLATLVVGMLGIVLLDWMLKGIRAKVLDSLAADVDMRLSKQVFHHLLHLRLDKQPNSLGTLNAQVNGLESVRQFFTSGIVFGLIDLPFALMFIAFIAVIGGVVS